MRTIRYLVFVFGALGVMTDMASAQALPWEDRGFFNIGVGAQTGSNDFTNDITFDRYGETATFTEQHPVSGGTLFDVAGGARVWQNLGVGVGVTRMSDTTDVTVAGLVPHPLFFNQLRGTTAQASGLERTETAVHIQALWMFVVTDQIDVALSLGPSFFSVSQDVVSGVTVTEGSPPFDTVAGASASVGRADDSGVGFNIGADVTYMATPNIGGGLFLRYTAASVDLATAGGTIASNAGGFQVGIGLRARF
jgi:hypothetical protein